MFFISVHNAKQHQDLDHPAGPIEFGRGRHRALPRCVIEDPAVSRDHLLVEEVPAGRARLRNLSTTSPATFSDGMSIPPQGEREIDLPVQVRIGGTTIKIALTRGEANLTPPARNPEKLRPPAVEPISKQEIEAGGYQSICPAHLQAPGPTLPRLAPLGDAPSSEKLTQWMETVLHLQRSEAEPSAFFAQAAQAIVNLIGLDVGLVLLYKDGAWQVVARAAVEMDGGSHPPLAGREFSHTILRHVLTQKQTFYQDLDLLKEEASLANVGAVVVSPVFGPNDEVTGVLYGSRSFLGRADCKIRPLEAQLIQLLAAAVGANVARTAAIRTRTQFEQFFSAELVRELERDPSLLEGRAHDVTILMSDLRGFSTVSEQLGPQQTCQLIRDVMEALSRRINEYGGVIVS